MVPQIRSGLLDVYGHVCGLPWPLDPDVPEGHVCECGRQWVYQPAHWDPLLTLEELRSRQEAGEFRRGIIPTFRPGPEPDRGIGGDETDVDEADSVIIPLPSV
jgi:hypothetical protein